MRIVFPLILVAAIALIGLLVYLLLRITGGRRRALLSMLAVSPLVFVGAVCLVLSLPAFWERWAVGPPQTLPATPDVPAPQLVEEPASAPAAARPLPIVGRIYDGDLQPLAGLEVACGDEKTVSGGEGNFAFPEALRPGRRPLILRKDGAEVFRWEAVVTGAFGPGEGESNEAGLEPEMVRWTLNLCRPRALGPAAVQPFAQATAVIVEEWGSTGAARIDGITGLPDGTHIDVAFYFNEERMLSSADRTEVRDGRFTSRIRFPDDFRIHSAPYDLHLLFGVSLEDPVDVERWKEARPEMDWSESASLVAVHRIFAGDPALEREENLRIEGQYGAMLDSVDRIRKILVTRSRKARELARGWDPEILMTVAESSRGALGGAILDASGRLDQVAWRRFMDEGLRPEIQRILERHLREKTGKFRSADFLFEALLRRLMVFSKVESLLAWSAWGLEPHPNDFYLDEERPEGDEGVLHQIIEKDLALLKNYRSLAASSLRAR